MRKGTKKLKQLDRLYDMTQNQKQRFFVIVFVVFIIVIFSVCFIYIVIKILMRTKNFVFFF